MRHYPATIFYSLFIIFLLSSSIQAATIMVTSPSDEFGYGPFCSLREAIQAANTDAAFGGCSAGSGTDNIIISVLAPTCEITIPGTNENDNATGDFDIKSDMNIIGQWAPYNTVDGKNIDRVFDIDNYRTVSFKNLLIRDGNATYDISTNRKGGGIKSYESDVTILNCLIQSNDADDGGGIYLQRGSLDIDSSIIKLNNATDSYGTGGGIQVIYGTCNLFECTILKNTATANGGGLYITDNQDTSTTAVTVEKCRIDSNVADANTSGSGDGGGLYCQGAALTVNATTISYNNAEDGGGVATYDCSPANLLLNNCTISDNNATDGGGGIFNNQCYMLVKNCTITNNDAGDRGKGIFNTEGYIDFINSIASYNPDGNTTGNLYGYYGNGPPSSTINFGTSITNGIDPILGPLQDNGGTTFTHALLAGSPALSAGSSTPFACLNIDQRGVLRPQPAGTPCDLGAYESDILPCTLEALAGDDIEICNLGGPNNAATVNGDYVVNNCIGTVQPEWTIAGGSYGLSTEWDYSFIVAGTTTLRLTVTCSGIANCTDYDDVTIYVNDLPTCNWDSPISYYYNNVDAVISGGTSGYSSYSWNDPSGELTIDTSSPYSDVNPNIYGGTPANSPYTVEVTITDENGCECTQNITINLLLDPCEGLLNNIVWVDDSWTTQSLGDDVSTLITVPAAQPTGTARFGCNAFNDLSEGYDAVDSGGIIYVHDGIYYENIIIGKDIAIIGENETATIVDGSSASRVFTVNVGIVVDLQNLTIQNGSMWGYTSTAAGGGVYLSYNAEGNLTNCSLIDNVGTYGGAIYNYYGGNLTLNDCTVSDNDSYTGGGIYNYYGASTTLSRCTFVGNMASTYGGGIYNYYYGTLGITNSTLSGNSAVYYGGGIYNYGILDQMFCTVTLNYALSGDGIYNVGTYTLNNTIVAFNPDLAGQNIFGAYSGLNNIIDGDPGLEALILNAPGSTETHALQFDSPALRGADCVLWTDLDPVIDQRGVARPQGAECDIGAYESDGGLFFAENTMFEEYSASYQTIMQ